MSARRSDSTTPADALEAPGLRAALEAAAEASGSSLDALTVLAPQNDPYRVDTPAGHRDGEWLAVQAARLPEGRPIHLRGLHYMVIGEIKPDGKPYQNNDDDWTWLANRAAKAARWLGYIPFERIIDQRNAAPVIRTWTPPDPQPRISAGRVEVEVGEIEPQVEVEGFVGAQPYKLVLFGEKASLDSVLAPIADRRMADLYLPSGEASDTMIHNMARVGHEDGRHMVVFYLSDCDPAGWQMAVSVARKLMACRDLLYPDLSFEVRPVALTPAQVRKYRLPSTPMKEGEKRADKWTRAMGVEQTEIDSIATLQPDLLARLVRQAIKPFFDTTLAERVSDARMEWRIKAQRVLDDSLGPDLLAQIREDAEAKLAELDEEVEALNDALRIEGIEGIELPEPVIPQAEITVEPDGKPLVHSDWGHAEMARALRAHKDYAPDGGHRV